MENSKLIKILQNSLLIKSSFAWNFALLLLIATMVVSSYADILVPDHSSVDVCAACPLFHLKEKSSGDHTPTSDNNHCFAYFHCHHQPTSLKVTSLDSLDRGHRLSLAENTPDFSQFVASIFHPPQIHI